MAAHAHVHASHRRTVPGSRSLILALAGLAVAGVSFGAPSAAAAALMGGLALALSAFATVMAVRNDDALANAYGSTAIVIGVITFLAVSASIFHWFPTPMTPGWR